MRKLGIVGNKIKKGIAVSLVTCMCIGSMTVFAALDSQVITKGSNIGLTNIGTSNQLYVSRSGYGNAEIVGGNYIFSTISNNKSGTANYVKTTVTYKNILGNWKTFGTKTQNMPTVGSVYCPRINMGSEIGVWGLNYYASNKFSSGETGYGKIADCKTSLTQAYVYAN